MKTLVLRLITTCTLLGLSQITWAQSSEPRFDRQIQIMDLIRPTLDRLDLARLLVIRNTLVGIESDIKNNQNNGRQPVTFQTLRLIQNLIIQYRYSQSYFGWTEPISLLSIYTPSTERYLLELKSLAKNTEVVFGLDDSPYTQITANTFRQVQRLLQQLESLPIDNNLKTQLRSLWKPVGDTIAIAEQGDRPKAFEKATEVLKLVRSFYPYFDQISASAAGFSSILEIQGLTEFYAEFAQAD